ncbi:MAG: hypothetical protein ACLUUO_06090 [Sellimonas intestinalis]
MAVSIGRFQSFIRTVVDNIDAMNITNMLNSNRAVKKQIESHNLTNMQEFIDMSQYACRDTFDEYKLLVKNVVTMSFKRDLNRVANEIQSMCFNEKADLSQVNQTVNKKINHLTEQYVTTNEVEMFGTKVDSLWQEVRDRCTQTVVSMESHRNLSI